jgi:competence protein ComEA
MLKKLLTVAALLYAACAFAGLDANQASKAELDAVKGIGPALAERIIAQRKKSPFIDWSDLIDRVHGVGRASAAKLSASGLTVNGQPYLSPPPPSTPQASAMPSAAPARIQLQAHP